MQSLSENLKETEKLPLSNEKSRRGGGTNRQSSIELFRIISMLLIVAHHYVVNSGLTATLGPINQNPLSWRSIFLLLFGAWGKMGINCFVLITGYFMCKSRITLRKFLKLLLQIEFYKIVIYLIFLITGYESFSFKGLLKSILPITSVSTGFTSCYLLFFLCIPFLNILANNMSEKQHICLLLVCFLIYIVLGFIPNVVTMNYVSWFIVIYFIGSYFRIYDKQIFNKTKLWGFFTLSIFIISCASVVFMTWFGVKIGKLGNGVYFYFLTDSNKILAVLLSVSAFLFFKNLKMRNSKFINMIAATTFGVLLIHANSDTMRNWLWVDLLKNVEMYSSSIMVLHALGSVILVFTICSLIDILRIQFLEKPLFKIYDKHSDKFKAKFIKLEEKVCQKFNIEQTKDKEK